MEMLLISFWMGLFFQGFLLPAKRVRTRKPDKKAENPTGKNMYFWHGLADAIFCTTVNYALALMALPGTKEEASDMEYE